MRSIEHAAPPAGWAEPRLPLRFISDTLTIADSEIRKVVHDPYELATRALQPILWLVIFGEVLAQSRVLSTGNLPYLDFLTPGVLAQSALFIAIFYGIAVIWERDLGVVQKMLVSPAPRVSLVLGKAIAGGMKGLVQAIIVYVVAFVIGVHIRADAAAIISVGVLVVLGSALFASFSLIIACIVRTRERFMGIGQVLTMPFFFASSAIYPVSSMPAWLQVVARVNPLTYMVDGIRGLMVVGGTSEYGLPLDAAVLVAGLTILIVIASRLYPRLAQ
ncbi:MAG TPA: ABC transporter permease [Candidatus Limnocylindrales bacterium]